MNTSNRTFIGVALLMLIALFVAAGCQSLTPAQATATPLPTPTEVVVVEREGICPIMFTDFSDPLLNHG